MVSLLVVLLILSSAVLAQGRVIRLGHIEPPDAHLTIEHAMAVTFKSIVESKTDMTVDIFPANQLGNEREMLESLQLGLQELVIVADGAVPIFFPQIQSLAIPYLFQNRTIGWEVLDGWFGEKLFEAMREKSSIRVLGTGRASFRNFTSNVGFFKSPSDLEGLMIRTMEHPAHMAIVRSLGGRPTPIPWGELYTALQTGVVEGQENPISVIISGKIYEVQKYLTLDEHVYSLTFLLADENWFGSLSPYEQQVVLEAGRSATIAGRGISQINDAMGIEYLQSRGMEVYGLSPEEKALFVEMSQGPVIEWLKDNIADGEAWVEDLLQATREVEELLGY